MTKTSVLPHRLLQPGSSRKLPSANSTVKAPRTPAHRGAPSRTPNGPADMTTPERKTSAPSNSESEHPDAGEQYWNGWATAEPLKNVFYLQMTGYVTLVVCRISVLYVCTPSLYFLFAQIMSSGLSILQGPLVQMPGIRWFGDVFLTDRHD